MRIIVPHVLLKDLIKENGNASRDAWGSARIYIFIIIELMSAISGDLVNMKILFGK